MPVKMERGRWEKSYLATSHHTHSSSTKPRYSPHLATRRPNYGTRSLGIVHTFQGHEGWVNSAIFSPDSNQVLTASDDYTAKLWDAVSGECVQTFQGHRSSVWSAVFSPDANQVLTASGDETAKLWDAESGKCVQTFHGHEARVTSAIFM